MERRTILLAAMAACGTVAFGVMAAPPEGKGPGHGGNPQGKGNSGRGNNGKGNNDWGNHGEGAPGRVNGSLDLVYAGITAALARRYALDLGLGGYGALPPGIRKNLARGKPLPPGIAKKLVPGALLGRLPRYDGYEWRVAGTDLILIAVAGAVIADVLYDVFA